MPIYTSHIYLEANKELLSFIKSDPILSEGLYHLRQLSPTNTNFISKNEYPKNGIVVIREICDPNKAEDNQDEAKINEILHELILSQWKLQGPQNLEVVIPFGSIPTLAFGTIYINHETNPPPPLEFLRFLKHLSLTQKASVVFYHHYSAYEDELANAEYAFVYGKQDSVYIRHMEEPYCTTQYAIGTEPKVVNSERAPYSQPILHLVMKELGATLIRSDNRRPYFYDFNWNDYRI